MGIKEIVCSLFIGIISGIISGYVVSIYFEKRNNQKRVEEFWRNYLWNSLEYCKMSVPVELLEMLKPLGGQKERFGTAIMNINDILYPLQEEEMTEEQQKLFENFMVAYEEYNKWLNKNNKKYNLLKNIHVHSK